MHSSSVGVVVVVIVAVDGLWLRLLLVVGLANGPELLRECRPRKVYTVFNRI